jgi:hypothetical protein
MGRAGGASPAVLAVRYGLPGLLVVAGIAMLIAGGTVGTGVGIVVIGGGLIVFGLNAFLRWSMREEKEREREEQAREYFRVHGRWPDEAE